MDIPLHILKEITKDFSDEHKIGSGGYGHVYKGVYNGEDIAVKLLHQMPGFDEDPFGNEFVNLMNIKHPHVVRLVGYCYDIQHKHVDYMGVLRFSQYIYRVLCFEYLQGGSLERYLDACAEGSRDRDWCTHFNIIKGVSEGLNFLHNGCGSPILHLDLKPANILLDKNMVAKIADVGLSRFFCGENTHITKTTKGTAKYMPPEQEYNKQLISPKNDVFSLGVIIIEVMAGPTGYYNFRQMDDVNKFIELVNMNWSERINATKSPCPSAESDQVETCIKIAIKCVDHERKNRPTVAEIVHILKEAENKFLEAWRSHAQFLMDQSLPTPTKSGLVGGSAGTARDIEEKPWRLESLTISYLGLIDAFSFSYIDQAGKKQTIGPWGEGYSHDKTETILFGPSEFVEEVSGTYGSHFGNVLVMSLTFVTNVRTYGPFGNPYHQNVPATPFRFRADEDSSIMGFHGRSGTHLYSIGVYTCPSNKTTVRALPAPGQLLEYWKKKMQATPGYTWDKTDLLGVKKCIEIAMTCVETDPNERPSTDKIIDDLNEEDAQIEKLRRKDPKSLMEIMSSSGVTNITLQLLKTITKDFSKEKKVGSGGYGEVYKGVLNGDEIAVKKLFPVHVFDEESFENEFNNLTKVKHKNIVRLIGYCYEITQKLTDYNGKHILGQVIDRVLCFEYMHEGSLAKHISAESCIHDWPTTYKIIKGTCEGLHYLHKGRGEKNYIYHLDLKPDNILLDKNMVPKIGDFGLSRLFGESKTYEISIKKGTIGFMPPEFINNGTMTPKNDVFSLGVIIFHIMAGRKGYNDYCDLRSHQGFLEKNRQDFIESVQEYWKKKMQATPGYTWDETDLLGVKKCIEIAMTCVETYRKERPSTDKIIDDLNEQDAQIEKMRRKDPKSLIGQSLPTPTKSGTCGGSAGTARDIKEKPWRLESLTIGYLGLIDEFSFSYTDQAGKKQSVGPWGDGYLHDKIETIHFGPSEFVEEVSGAYGSHFDNVLVMSLTFVTNIRTYGPFGNPHHQNVPATPFRFRAEKDSSIVGFHGRSGQHLYSIGVYTV